MKVHGFFAFRNSWKGRVRREGMGFYFSALGSPSPDLGNHPGILKTASALLGEEAPKNL